MTVMRATCWLVVTHGPAKIVGNGLERNLAVNVSNFHGIDEFFNLNIVRLQVQDQIVFL